MIAEQNIILILLLHWLRKVFLERQDSLDFLEHLEIAEPLGLPEQADLLEHQALVRNLGLQEHLDLVLNLELLVSLERQEQAVFLENLDFLEHPDSLGHSLGKAVLAA